MMNKIQKILALAALALLLVPFSSSAQNNTTYILQSPSLAQAQAACQTYGWTILSTIHAPDTYLVQTPGPIEHHLIEHDPNVVHLQPNAPVHEEHAGPADYKNAPIPSSVPPSTLMTDKGLLALYGATTWAAYVQQKAVYSTNILSAVTKPNFTGAGIIGIIDTGVDEHNPILAPVLVPGYDFTRNTAGYADDDGDLNQSTAHILHQSTAHILHGYTTMQLNPFVSGVLDADTAAALQGTTLPDDYGHGTMVAGLIHLVAPTAQIMSLKAFNADGSANESDIERAIYYAADNGVSVLNMSFGLPKISDALLKVINYANRKGVVCIASVGNDGQNTMLYPAAFGNVIGVASVNPQNQPSAFTNYGADMVTLAAPGENLVTTYPGNHYALVSGTSFSAALVSGAADLLLFDASGDKTIFQPADIQRSLKVANPCVTDGSLGGGCMDLNLTLEYIKDLNVPANADSLSSAVGRWRHTKH